MEGENSSSTKEDQNYNETMDDLNPSEVKERIKPHQKRRKPGIVYLSSIPPNMNVSKIREYFGKFGEIDRVFLQATDVEDKSKGGRGKKSKKSLKYSEGWVEFKSKRKAKQMHLFMNNQPVGGKKKNPYYDMLWNIKYLPRFKWAFLKQRLEYEREVYRQRMGVEISQVRRETDHFIKVSEISTKKEKKRMKVAKEKEDTGREQEVKGTNGEGGVIKKSKEKANKGKIFVFKQKETEDEKLSKSELRKKKNELFRSRIADKKKKKKMVKKTDDFLGSVFVGGANTD